MLCCVPIIDPPAPQWMQRRSLVCSRYLLVHLPTRSPARRVPWGAARRPLSPLSCGRLRTGIRYRLWGCEEEACYLCQLFPGSANVDTLYTKFQNATLTRELLDSRWYQTLYRHLGSACNLLGRCVGPSPRRVTGRRVWRSAPASCSGRTTVRRTKREI